MRSVDRPDCKDTSRRSEITAAVRKSRGSTLTVPVPTHVSLLRRCEGRCGMRQSHILPKPDTEMLKAVEASQKYEVCILDNQNMTWWTERV